MTAVQAVSGRGELVYDCMWFIFVSDKMVIFHSEVDFGLRTAEMDHAEQSGCLRVTLNEKQGVVFVPPEQ